MKTLWLVLFLSFTGGLLSADITGEWWRYDSDSQEHDHLTIDGDLNFLLELTMLEGKPESFRGTINIIGGGDYYTQITYNDEIKNCRIYSSSTEHLFITIYKNESDALYGTSFIRDKVFPEPKQVKVIEEPKFIILPTLGTFGGILEHSGGQNEFLLSVDIYSIYFSYQPAGLELNFVPAKYFFNCSDQSHTMTFLNAELYWDAINYVYIPNNGTRLRDDRKISLGPLVSVNWLTLNNNSFNTDKMIFNAGLKFRYSSGNNEISFFALETGYKNTAGKHGFYVNISIDNIIPLIATGLTTMMLTGWPALFWAW